MNSVINDNKLLACCQWIFLFLTLLCLQPAFAIPTTPTSDFIDNQDGTVTHKTTGLMWMRCAMRQTWTGSTCSGSASTYSYAQAIAFKSTFAGYSDWRLPNIAELQTIVERENMRPAINTAMFPNTPSYGFWSSSPSPYDDGTSYAFSVGSTGTVGPDNRSDGLLVRLVHASQSLGIDLSTPNTDFTDNKDGTVTHKRTGLIWQRCSVGQTWTGSRCSGSARDYSYDAAIALKITFAGHSDWRVPNANELASIVKYDSINPSINQDQFPDMAINMYRSSSPYVGNTDDGWCVYFNNGWVFGCGRYSLPVRLVRGKWSAGFSPKKAVLLLHGMNSNLETWDKLVNSDAGFDKHCTNTNADDFTTIKSVANSEGVYCFRMNFGLNDRSSSAPTGLDGKTCLENNGCSGDYSTFNSLGVEVGTAIKRIKSKLGDNTKIILLGHSRGGLAARAFLQGKRPEKSNVVGLITTGTPHAGSPLGRYYFYLNDNCTPESEHYKFGDICIYDWDFVNALLIKDVAGLDMKAPTIGFLAEDSVDFINANPYTIRELNDKVGNLPDIEYTQLFYNGINFGCLGGNPFYPVTGCGYNIFSKVSKAPSQEGLAAVLHDRTRKLLGGDGIVPKLSQKMSEVAGFPSANVNEEPNGNGKRVHTAETNDILSLSKVLNAMYKSLQWIP